MYELRGRLLKEISLWIKFLMVKGRISLFQEPNMVAQNPCMGGRVRGIN